MVTLNLKSVFAGHGIPEEIVRDNMPFVSKELKAFAQQWSIHLIPTSPRYPCTSKRLGGTRNIQTVKRLLRKDYHNGPDPYLALLNFRTAPIAEMKHSPADRALDGRPLRTKLHARLSGDANPTSRRAHLDAGKAQAALERILQQRSGPIQRSSMQLGDLYRVQRNRDRMGADDRNSRTYNILPHLARIW